MLVASNTENINDLRYLETRIRNWLHSQARLEQINGDNYYRGLHDILKKKRTVIGQDGEIVEVNNLPNNKAVNNQFGKMVDQKKNYLLGKPISFVCDDEAYIEKIQKVFNNRFQKILSNVAENAIIGGIAWVHPYYKDNELRFKQFPAHEILPFWEDNEHTELAMAVRHYYEEKPDAIDEHDLIQKIEIYTKNGVDYYTFENNRLIPDVTKKHQNYIKVIDGDKEQAYNWERIPLVAFKFNNKEIPLISRCKELQDAINDITNMFKNVMEEDTRNTILVLENYDGQNLGEFRQNLAQYGAVKVRSSDGSRGDVRTLRIEVNSQNYESLIMMFKDALMENCKGYDFGDLNNAASDPNQMNIKSIYADIDLDADDMEMEFQASLEELLWFVNQYLHTTHDIEEKPVTFIFNRDNVVNDIEVLHSLVTAGVKISNRTLLAQVPFVDDVDAELEYLKEEEEEAMDAYGGVIPKIGMNNAKKAASMIDGGRQLPDDSVKDNGEKYA